MTHMARPSFITDQYYRWIVVLYGLLLQAISVGTVIYCFALFTLPWLEEFGSSRRDLMLTIALLQIGAGVLGPLAGRALDKYPLHWLIFTGLASMVLGLFARASPRCGNFAYLRNAAAGHHDPYGHAGGANVVSRWFDEGRGWHSASQ